MRRATYFVSVNGVDIGSKIDPVLTSITITDSDGGKSDTLEIELDDGDASFGFPPTNAPIQAGICWEDEDGGPSTPPVMFAGKVDKVTSTYSRGGSLMLTISAKSADEKGKAKERQEKHHDKGKLSEVAKKFGKDAGLDVRVTGDIDVERDYWAMHEEDFLAWGTRIAAEVGATFKVRAGQAIFAERSAGMTGGGRPLATVAVRPGPGGNLISGTLSPSEDVDAWKRFRVRYYDTAKAKYVTVDEEQEERPGTVTHTHRATAADADTAKRRAKSNKAEADRDRGGGSVQIDGEPTAQAEAMCEVTGWRPGIDGTYRIASATHRLTRSASYITTLELKKPGGSAGEDSRGSGGVAS